MITLYDAWVLKSPRYAEVPKIASWTPIDHVTLPPKVEEWLVRPNVTPIAMAPNGQRILNEKGIDHVYIPHAVDTAVFKPVEKMPSGQAVTDYFGSSERFVVGMVAANKASGMVHRKSFSENLMAFSIFKKRHPEALLYLHTEPIGMMGGWNLLELLKALGISPQDVMFPNPHDQRFGVSDETMAALYSGIDVLLAPSMGEGFGVPTIEAQACGTRVIVSSWAASQDLASKDSWLVEGQPVWDNMQNAWWMTPQIPSIVEALEQALQAGKTRSMDARKFAKGFDVEKVWFDNWMPALRNWLQH
jgi:glycosyltransferase involved in cell wall biosynthesis